MGEQGYRPRFGKDIRIRPDAPLRVPDARGCDTQGCARAGGYRVPRSRNALNEHFWFCLEHARAHNEHWDYFRGMSEAEIEAFRADAIIGHRPTWPLGKRAAQMHRQETFHPFHDCHEVFGDGAPNSEPPRCHRPLTQMQTQALDVLNLESGASLHQIKARYKELVKRFHPDANGGDRGAEERLKRVIRAYGVLRASGLT